MNLICERFEQFILIVQTKINPTQAEWDTATLLVKTSPVKIIGSLVHTEGGSPTALQRKRLREIFLETKNETSLSAIMTNDVFARTAIKALNLFFSNTFKSFQPSEIEDAFDYIKVPFEKRPTIKQKLSEMKELLGIVDPSSKQ